MLMKPWGLRHEIFISMMRNRLAPHIDFADLSCALGKRLPCKLDMVLERKSYFIIGEWKRSNEKMGMGQQILLRHLAQVDKFTVLIIRGDTDNGMVVDKIWQLLPDGAFKVIGNSKVCLETYLLNWLNSK